MSDENNGQAMDTTDFEPVLILMMDSENKFEWVEMERANGKKTPLSVAITACKKLDMRLTDIMRALDAKARGAAPGITKATPDMIKKIDKALGRGGIQQ